jgi:hypothetical protein
LAIDQRRADLGLAASGLPTNTPDASITYSNINSARAQITTLTPSYLKPASSILSTGGILVDPTFTISAANNTNYNDLLTTLNIGGLLMGVRQWTNITSGGVVAYDALMNSTDQLTSLMYAELEICLKALKYRWLLEEEISLNYTGVQDKTITLSGLPTWFAMRNGNATDPFYQTNYGDWILSRPVGGTSIAFGSVNQDRAFCYNAKFPYAGIGGVKLRVTGQPTPGWGEPYGKTYQYKHSIVIYSEDVKLGTKAK